jgi:hypothetical protein
MIIQSIVYPRSVDDTRYYIATISRTLCVVREKYAEYQ